jgi:asparagine synthase (glutamine-hydrolysing)
VAKAVGTRHQEAAVTREMFRERWPMLVAAAGVPLSTPNEVAIHEVASRLRADGQVVTLSGEGADEFFAGYELPMRQAAEFERQLAGTGATDTVLQRAMFQIDSNAWVPRGAKANILRGEVFQAAGRDEAMGETYLQIMAACEAEAMEDSPLQMHLMLHQRVNLVGLLLRLDSATMRASVEGRTPFADVEVARAANGLAMGLKFGEGDGMGAAVHPEPNTHRAGTKIVLREGYRGVLPVGVIDRPKASFPLPFQEWVADFGGVLRASGFAREIFTAQAIETVASRPGEFWSAAWPMVNLALWGEVFA